MFLIFRKCILTLNLLTTAIVAPPSNASKWQMGFNSAFKGLMAYEMCEIISFTFLRQVGLRFDL